MQGLNNLQGLCNTLLLIESLQPTTQMNWETRCNVITRSWQAVASYGHVSCMDAVHLSSSMLAS